MSYACVFRNHMLQLNFCIREYRRIQGRNCENSVPSQFYFFFLSDALKMMSTVIKIICKPLKQKALSTVNDKGGTESKNQKTKSTILHLKEISLF